MVQFFLINRVHILSDIQRSCIEFSRGFEISSVLEDLLNKPVGLISTILDIEHDANDWELWFVCVGIHDVQFEVVVLSIEGMFWGRMEMELEGNEFLDI